MAKHENFLSSNQIRKISPAALKGRMTSTEMADHGLSEKYQFYPTSQLIKDMGEMGWGVVGVKATKVHEKNEAFKDKARHAIRFRSESFTNRVVGVGELIPELLVTNAHNGTAKLKVHAALYRKVCSNGMCVTDRQLDRYAIRHHSSFNFDQVRDNIKLFTERIPVVLSEIEKWKKIRLNEKRQLDFAVRALVLRHTELFDQFDRTIDMDTLKSKYKPMELLQSQRQEDNGGDLWHTLNRVQENLVKGNYTHYSKSAEGKDTSKKARTIDWAQDPNSENYTNIDMRKSLLVNKGLWTLAQDFAGALS